MERTENGVDNMEIIINKIDDEEVGKQDVFYTCDTLSVNETDNTNDLKIFKSVPEDPQINTHYLTLSDKGTWELTYITQTHEKIKYSGVEVDLSTVEKELSEIAQDLNFNEKALELIEEIKYKFYKNLNKISHTINIGYLVRTTGSNTGTRLYSEGFGPCRAVVAVYKRKGTFALYHSFTPYDDKNFNRFINLINKEEIDAVYIFNKNKEGVHLEKEDYLAIRLGSVLFKKNVPIRSFLLENYYCIAIENNKIILGLKYKPLINNTKWLKTTELTTHSLGGFQPFEMSIQRTLKSGDFQTKIGVDSVMIIKKISCLTIPSQFIIDTALYVLEKNQEELKSTEHNPKFFKKNKLSLKSALEIIKNDGLVTSKNFVSCTIL